MAPRLSLFQQAGMPAVVCGPLSIEQAPKPNKYVSLDQLAMVRSDLKPVVRGY